MAVLVYNPFKRLNFSNNTCFLTGNIIENPEVHNYVFPIWLMQHYQLNEKPFKLLDESIATYQDMKIPMSEEVQTSSDLLESKIANAFLSGYDAVCNLPELDLFQWIAKLVYGILYNELEIGIKQQQRAGEPLILSEALKHRFTNLHLMLQSLVRPVEFETGIPWSYEIFKVDNATDHFNYRDEINTLTFSLSMKDFGIIACLQDNGANSKYHQEVLSKVAGSTIHPIQYEEICGRFYYSNYLFNRLPEYTVLTTDEAIYLEAMPLHGMSNKPLFDHWQNKPFCQVLENFWKPWGFNIFEIQKDPENPMSFLFDTEGKLLALDKIAQPN
ncbi:MAG: hypothetical protein JWN56_2616 [Sphingobacteriales bacterium]|nr:hypothetical protein [Sphingobacteriales bacterium]